jgi:hypothetical protein
MLNADSVTLNAKTRKFSIASGISRLKEQAYPTTAFLFSVF